MIKLFAGKHGLSGYMRKNVIVFLLLICAFALCACDTDVQQSETHSEEAVSAVDVDSSENVVEGSVSKQPEKTELVQSTTNENVKKVSVKGQNGASTEAKTTSCQQKPVGKTIDVMQKSATGSQKKQDAQTKANGILPQGGPLTKEAQETANPTISFDDTIQIPNSNVGSSKTDDPPANSPTQTSNSDSDGGVIANFIDSDDSGNSDDSSVGNYVSDDYVFYTTD